MYSRLSHGTQVSHMELKSLTWYSCLSSELSAVQKLGVLLLDDVNVNGA